MMDDDMIYQDSRVKMVCTFYMGESFFSKKRMAACKLHFLPSLSSLMEECLLLTGEHTLNYTKVGVHDSGICTLINMFPTVNVFPSLKVGI